jgi:uncharacterized protein YjbI with pentapeptide repeats
MEGQGHEKLCFAIMPIGGQESEEKREVRRRSDQILGEIIRPVAARLGYKTERADEISQPGSVIHQMVSHLRNAELVVADLTGHNANVFYELAIRHMTGKPVVSIIEEGEEIPFDVAQLRTIQVDHNDSDSIERCKNDLERQIRSVEQNPEASSIPVIVDLEMRWRQIDDAQHNALTDYIDYMSELLIDRQLREAEWDSDIRVGARGRTLAFLQQLDKDRKRDVLRFLHEAALIKKEDPSGHYTYPVIGLDDADLNGADLSNINLSGDALYGAHAQSADLGNANLSYANLRGIDLSEANLGNADLGSADLGPDPEHGPVRLTSLRGAYLIGAHLVSANLTEADLTGTKLRGADLQGTVGLTQEQLEGAVGDRTTRLPDHLRFPEAWMESAGR